MPFQSPAGRLIFRLVMGRDPAMFANSNRLTLRNVTPAMAGNYSLFVSNYLGTDISSNALLTVTPVLNTEQMTNIWSLSPGDRPYVSTANTERGLNWLKVTKVK